MFKIIPQTEWAFEQVSDFARSIGWVDCLLVVGFVSLVILFAAFLNNVGS